MSTPLIPAFRLGLSGPADCRGSGSQWARRLPGGFACCHVCQRSARSLHVAPPKTRLDQFLGRVPTHKTRPGEPR